MKIKVLSILFLSSLIFFSCAKEEEMKKFEASVGDDRIASIEQQIDSINSTIVQLEKLNTALNKYVSTMQNEIDSVKITQSKDRESIAKMELAVAEVKAVNEKVLKEIDALHSYVDNQIAEVKGWAEGTFMTMEYYDTLCAVVSQVRVDMKRVSSEMDSLRAHMTEECRAIVDVAVKQAVVQVEASLKAWVNEQLSGYWTAELAKAKLDSTATVLRVEIDTAKAQLTRAYTKAISDAINNYDGVIRQHIQDTLAVVNGRIDALGQKVDALTARVDKLEHDFAARIQSIVPVPDYDDGSVKLQGNATGSVIRFKVLPESAIDTIVKYGIPYLSVEYKGSEVVTKSDALSSLTVTDVEKEDGLLKITVKTDGLENDYWLGKKVASTCLTVGNGDNRMSSQFFGMRCIPTMKLVYDIFTSDTMHRREVLGCSYGSTMSVTASVYPDKLKYKFRMGSGDCSFSISNKNIVRMDSIATRYASVSLLALCQGKSTITVKCGVVSESFDINVVQGWNYVPGTGWRYYTIPGAFSISAEKKVVFMQGNVMFKADENSAFQPDCHQFTSHYVGNAEGNVRIDGPQPYDKMDLFGLSTDKAAKEWGINSSTNNADYKGAFRDWGKYYSDATNWFTLSKTEWVYLLSLRKDASKKVGFGTLTDDGGRTSHGIFILPDVFDDPKTNKGGTDPFVPMDVKTGWDANVYSDLNPTRSSWKSMLERGAVFLPAAGKRVGNTVTEYNECGYYWTSTIDWETDAHQIIKFDSSKIYISLGDGDNVSSAKASVGQAIRLAHVLE